jgi:hypothetical protein
LSERATFYPKGRLASRSSATTRLCRVSRRASTQWPIRRRSRTRRDVRVLALRRRQQTVIRNHVNNETPDTLIKLPEVLSLTIIQRIC